MPRFPRAFLAHFPHHVIHRGDVRFTLLSTSTDADLRYSVTHVNRVDGHRPPRFVTLFKHARLSIPLFLKSVATSFHPQRSIPLQTVLV